MDLLGLLIIVVVGLVAFGALAVTVGADSRDGFRDDWSGTSRI